jgi:hypothetical protein
MYLTPEQLRQLTQRRRSDAQRRELDHLGIPYFVRSDGTLAVLKVHGEPGGTIAPQPETELEPELMP